MNSTKDNKIFQPNIDHLQESLNYSSTPPENEINKNSDQSTCLYVGDLPLNLKEEDIEKIFLTIGPLKSVKIYRDISSGEFMGYCFVEFENFKDAERALTKLNYYFDPEKMKKPLRLMWYQKDKFLLKSGGGNIFIKNLPLFFDSKSLEKMFLDFGKILSCKVALDENGTSLGYGFVHFEDEKASKIAIEKTNGLIIGEKKIFVGPFLSRKDRKNFGMTKTGFTNIYIKNISPENCNETFIKDLFDIFGKITSIYIPKNNNFTKGFAFVNYELPEEAEDAIFRMNKKKIKNLTLYVGKAETKIERQRHLQKKFLEKKIGPIEKPPNSILININIPITITEDFFVSRIISIVAIRNFKIPNKTNKNFRKHSFTWINNLENFSKLTKKNEFLEIKDKKIVNFSDFFFSNSNFGSFKLDFVSQKKNNKMLIKKLNNTLNFKKKHFSSENYEKIQISIFKLLKRTFSCTFDKKRNIKFNPQNIFLKNEDILVFFFCTKFLKKTFFLF
ncbi:pab1 (nucleomorph) [Hemiselmis andersenii]|uniref:Pab1 n=1 Tax=Hemiselmis andersenii TaxID=464988 RepID=A9BK51_HEMAN|nr:pab1 [Hemiselmis andersenii]ABW97884.1 pab1 [Hemiselmis andersenii]|mmetsp:Transcript_10544/g.24780  ORF Transcript_10544/g.24780 Transcript_10544/m.24780 type:complete len:503 (-) Transcript_10544:490-1998(-)